MLDDKTFDVFIVRTIRRRVKAPTSQIAYDVAHNTDDGETKVIGESTDTIEEVEESACIPN